MVVHASHPVNTERTHVFFLSFFISCFSSALDKMSGCDRKCNQTIKIVTEEEGNAEHFLEIAIRYSIWANLDRKSSNLTASSDWSCRERSFPNINANVTAPDTQPAQKCDVVTIKLHCDGILLQPRSVFLLMTESCAVTVTLYSWVIKFHSVKT